MDNNELKKFNDVDSEYTSWDLLPKARRLQQYKYPDIPVYYRLLLRRYGDSFSSFDNNRIKPILNRIQKTPHERCIIQNIMHSPASTRTDIKLYHLSDRSITGVDHLIHLAETLPLNLKDKQLLHTIPQISERVLHQENLEHLEQGDVVIFSENCMNKTYSNKQRVDERIEYIVNNSAIIDLEHLHPSSELKLLILVLHKKQTPRLSGFTQVGGLPNIEDIFVANNSYHANAIKHLPNKELRNIAIDVILDIQRQKGDLRAGLATKRSGKWWRTWPHGLNIVLGNMSSFLNSSTYSRYLDELTNPEILVVTDSGVCHKMTHEDAGSVLLSVLLMEVVGSLGHTKLMELLDLVNIESSALLDSMDVLEQFYHWIEVEKPQTLHFERVWTLPILISPKCPLRNTPVKILDSDLGWFNELKDREDPLYTLIKDKIPRGYR